MIARAVLAAWFYAHPGCSVVMHCPDDGHWSESEKFEVCDGRPAAISVSCDPPCLRWKEERFWRTCEETDPKWRDPLAGWSWPPR